MAGARMAALTRASRMVAPMAPRGFRRASMPRARAGPGRASSLLGTVVRTRDSPPRGLGDCRSDPGMMSLTDRHVQMFRFERGLCSRNRLLGGGVGRDEPRSLSE